MQLKPCLGRYIFDEPINSDYKLEHQLGQHCREFEVITQNHRQDGDRDYADMLNRFRVGQQTEEDMEKLQTRVRPINHPDIKNAVFISCKTRKLRS